MEKRKRGRPLKYETAAELQAAVDKYFESCRGSYRQDDTGAYALDKSGRPILDGAVPFTITGLQRALGFKSRQSLLNYGGRKQYADIIQRARLRVECYAEERLFDRDGYAGAAWLLAVAFGWGRDASANRKALPVVRVVQKA